MLKSDSSNSLPYIRYKMFCLRFMDVDYNYKLMCKEEKDKIKWNNLSNIAKKHEEKGSTKLSQGVDYNCEIWVPLKKHRSSTCGRRYIS